MIIKKEKKIIVGLIIASIFVSFFSISVAIYLGVMTNVATNFFAHYTRGIQMVKIIQNIMSDLVVRMDQASTPLVKISMFIIFFWFGALKPLGISAAEQLVLDTVYWMPFLSPKKLASSNRLLGNDYRCLFSI